MPTEKDTFNAELDAILGELAFDTGEEGSSEAFAALSAELDGTEFGFGPETGLMSMLDVDGDPMMEELIFNIIKNRARGTRGIARPASTLGAQSRPRQRQSADRSGD